MAKKKEIGAKNVPIVLQSCVDCINMETEYGIVGFCHKSRMPRPVKTLKECIFYKKIYNNI